MKFRQRYLVFRLISQENLNEDDFKLLINSLITKMKELYGIRGFIYGVPFLLKAHTEKKMGIIICNNKNIHMVRSALSTLKEVNSKEIIPYVVKVSGTRKKAINILQSYTPKDLITA